MRPRVRARRTHTFRVRTLLVCAPRQESATGEQVALQGRGARHDGGREGILNAQQ